MFVTSSETKNYVKLSNPEILHSIITIKTLTEKMTERIQMPPHQKVTLNPISTISNLRILNPINRKDTTLPENRSCTIRDPQAAHRCIHHIQINQQVDHQTRDVHTWTIVIINAYLNSPGVLLQEGELTFLWELS